MSQADLGTAHPLEADKASATEAETKGSRKRELPRLASDLLGSASRIAIYAGATAAVGLIIVVLALLASGILAV